MAYEPRPIDTRSVSLPSELLELTERLAEHAHDVWARQRMSDGWTYGARRDDQTKRHPCLLPYAELPESEKEYDRQMTVQTLAAILSLGYEIRRR